MVGRTGACHAGEVSIGTKLAPVDAPASAPADAGVVLHGWLGVELRHLVTLAVVARVGSFRGAAEQLGYVQSAVSQQIAVLERAVGVRLVERSRGNRRVALTRSGELLVGHATEILTRLGAARADLTALCSDRPDEVRVGLSPGVGRWVLADILRLLAARRPETRVAITESARRETLAALVEEGELDVAVVEQPLPAGALQRCELLRDPYALLLPAEELRPGSWRPVSLEEVAALPLIGPTTPPPYAEFCGAEGIQLRFAVRSDLDELVPALVRAGLGAAILPRHSIPAHARDLRVLALDALLPPRVLSLIWHRDRSLNRVVEGFLAAALDACAPECPALAATGA
jgi:DNA-binding transcriptional LysR family regulator